MLAKRVIIGRVQPEYEGTKRENNSSQVYFLGPRRWFKKRRIRVFHIHTRRAGGITSIYALEFVSLYFYIQMCANRLIEITRRHVHVIRVEIRLYDYQHRV